MSISVRRPPLPSERVADWNESASRAVTWQAGHLEPEAHKRFFDLSFKFAPASVNVMGKYGEVSRAWRYRELGIVGLEDTTSRHGWESRFVGWFLERVPEFAPIGLINTVRDVLIESYRQANSYGLSGLAAADFFYLNQVARRAKSAEAAAQNALVITPLLTPETIIASYGMSAADRMNNALHRYILARYGPPAWKSINFVNNSDQVKAMHLTSHAVLTPWERLFAKTRASPFYDNLELWRSIGHGVLQEVTNGSGLVATLFQRKLPVEMALAMPDELFVISTVDRRFA